MKFFFILILMIIFLVPAASFGDECVDGDCVNGTGTKVFSTGHKYTGGFKDGVRHGKGVLLMPGGRKIVGVWVDNQIREGKFTAHDGTIYEGQWEFRERNGQGTLIYPDGRQYVGDFKYGERTGQGTMTYPDGQKYTGEFKDGERNGQGTLVYPDGRKLEGEFKNGEFVKK